MLRKIITENDVKDKLVKLWYEKRGAWHYAPIQTGLGEHGIHDRIGCVPIVVTPAMVGKKIGLFVSVEAKKPGRRGEPRRGMSMQQERHMTEIRAAGGVSICCDSYEDLVTLEITLATLTSTNPLGLIF